MIGDCRIRHRNGRQGPKVPTFGRSKYHSQAVSRPVGKRSPGHGHTGCDTRAYRVIGAIPGPRRSRHVQQRDPDGHGGSLLGTTQRNCGGDEAGYMNSGASAPRGGTDVNAACPAVRSSGDSGGAPGPRPQSRAAFRPFLWRRMMHGVRGGAVCKVSRHRA